MHGQQPQQFDTGVAGPADNAYLDHARLIKPAMILPPRPHCMTLE
jgi:hypothetical protein